MKFEFSKDAFSSAPKTVAQQHPARAQREGGYLFRPKYQGRNPPVMWGWTSSLDLAHPDYFKEGDVPRGCQRVEINGRSVLVYLADVNQPLTDDDQAAISEYAEFLEGKGPRPRADISTDERLQADMVASEAAEKSQPKEHPVTELTLTGADTGRYTEHMRYRLPPELERAEVKFDGYKRYKLPSPSTGKLTAFTRSTTVSSTTGDHYNLGLWKQRTKVQAVLIAAACATAAAFATASLDEDDEKPELVPVEMFGRTIESADVYRLASMYRELLDAYENGKAQDPNRKIDAIDNVIGGAEAREHGQAVHEWLGAVDSGQVLMWQVPEEYVVHVRSYQECLKRAGLIAIPIYVERIVMNDHGEESVAGTIDRIYLCVETGELYLGDLKTSKTLEWSALEYGIQFAIYGFARLMLRLDGTGWDDMPVINLEQCFCVHVPSDQPERSQVVPFYLYPGGEFAVTALEVRKQRKEADKKIFGGAYPIPSEQSLRYVEARQALQNMHDVEEAQAIMQQYEDVWDDDLTAFGATCFEAISTSTATEGH